jgi:hypothetical protein
MGDRHVKAFMAVRMEVRARGWGTQGAHVVKGLTGEGGGGVDGIGKGGGGRLMEPHRGGLDKEGGGLMEGRVQGHMEGRLMGGREAWPRGCLRGG